MICIIIIFIAIDLDKFQPFKVKTNSLVFARSRPSLYEEPLCIQRVACAALGPPDGASAPCVRTSSGRRQRAQFDMLKRLLSYKTQSSEV